MSGDGNNSNQLLGAVLEELTKFCRSKSLSEDGLAARMEMIEKHGCTANITNYKFFHWACFNKRLTEGILRYLLEYFPNAPKNVDEGGELPLHLICYNKNVTLNMVQLLIDAYPDSLRHESNSGRVPLHSLCYNNQNFDAVLDVLKFFLERYPESVRHTADGMLPIHIAAMKQSPDCCRILVEAYPGSEQITNGRGMLPFHLACSRNTVATVKYLYQLYPESINVADNNGMQPIYHVMMGIQLRNEDPTNSTIEVAQFLLDCNPNVALQKFRDKLPLRWFFGYALRILTNEHTRQLNACLKIVQILYDAYPEAIYPANNHTVTADATGFRREIQTFINAQVTYAQQARDRTLMTTPDENGQLPLHKVLQNSDITLGSIKLLVKGNPSAVQSPNNGGALPLHLASQQSESAISISIVKYLAGLDPTTLGAVDEQGNTALHYACRGAKHKMVALLTETYGAVSKRNARNQLPIHLLLLSNEVSDRECIKYTDSIFRLIRAYPETVMRAQSEHATIGQKRRLPCLQD
jgi:ankyrin repeat protein